VISITGNIGSWNFYPATHILGVGLVQITGLPLESIPFIFPTVFSILYLLNLFLLAKSTAKYFGQVLFIVVFASPLIYSGSLYNISPYFLSTLMVPCLLYCYQRRERFSLGRRQSILLMFLLAFFIVFSHPTTTLFTIIILIAFGVFQKIFLLRHRISKIKTYRIPKNYLGIALILFITFFTWYFSYSVIQKFFLDVYNWLFYRKGTPLINAILKPLEASRLSFFQTLELFINRFGAIFSSLLISSVVSLSVLYHGLFGKRDVEPMRFIYSGQFLLTLFIGIVMIFGKFVEYSPIRVVRFAVMLSPIVIGMWIYNLIHDNRNNSRRIKKTTHSWNSKAMISVIALTITVMASLGMGSIYGSPRVWDVNHQVMQTDISGTKWFGTFKDREIIVITNIPEQIERFEDYNFGREPSLVIRARVDSERLPSHFGYDKYSQIAQVFGFQDGYLIIFGMDKAAVLLYSKCPSPKVHIFTEEDFVKLSSDITATKVYHNGEFEVWRIYGMG